jgi:hypothetical protein
MKEMEEATPGPGSYKVNNTLLQEKDKQIKMGVDARFKQGAITPGPYDTEVGIKLTMKSP